MSTSSSPVSPAWEALITTLQRAEEWAERSVTEGQLLAAQKEPIVREWHQRREEYLRLARTQAPVPSVSDILPLQPDELPAVRALRLWRFLAQEGARLKIAGRITLSQAHAWQEEARERMTSLQRQLVQKGVTVTPPRPQQDSSTGQPSSATAWDFLKESSDSRSSAGTPGASTARPRGEKSASLNSPRTALELEETKPRRNILEMLLDPRSIQWLLGLGGALMVVGLVILLWVNEFFTPPVMALVMGVTNIAVLIGGCGLIRMSRYQFVGKALTLLACLVMPLNLWYYHSQGLITIDGHLWVAAVVISALYAAAAWVLQDEVFVYVFCAGVAMTGLMILADSHKFQEIALPATLLVMLGLGGIHVERAFGAIEGPFSRQRFGLAFFRSGHVLMASGLLLVLIAQLAGDWLYAVWFQSVYRAWGAEPSPICNSQLWVALSLVLLATYADVYSDLVVKRQGVYLHIAAFTLLWAEMIGVKMLNLELKVDAIISVLALTSLVVNLAQSSLAKDQKLTRSFPMFGLLLSLLPVVLGIVEYFKHLGLREVWREGESRWSYVGAMLLTAVASRLGAYLYRNASNWLPTAYHFGTAASTMVAAVAALAALGLEKWQEHAPIMMLIPIAYLAAAKLYGEGMLSKSLTAVAHTATVVMLISSMSSAFTGFTHLPSVEEKLEEKLLNLALAVFFAEATLFYGLVTVFQRQPRCVHLAALMVCGSLWQLMAFCGFRDADAYILAFAGIGLALLLVYQFSVIEQTAAAPLAEAAFQAANSVLSLAFVSSVFRGLGRLTQDAFGSKHPMDWDFVGTSVTMLVIAALAVLIVKVSGWRRWYVVNVVAQGALTLLAMHKLINLNPWQQVELFSVIVGLLLLGVGHLGWYREQDRESDLVSMSLFFGALLAAVPLAIATWIDRGKGQFLIMNEIGFLFVSVLLLGTGAVFRLKSTTLVGSLSTALYFLTLLMFVPWGRLSTIAILITVGGGLIFGTGLVLAFFRDRLLTLPERIKNREGVFKVLNWR